jgi:hypothetical protein
MTAKPKRVRCAVYTRVSTEYGLDQEFEVLTVVVMLASRGFRACGRRGSPAFIASSATSARAAGRGAADRVLITGRSSCATCWRRIHRPLRHARAGHDAPDTAPAPRTHQRAFYVRKVPPRP